MDDIRVWKIASSLLATKLGIAKIDPKQQTKDCISHPAQYYRVYSQKQKQYMPCMKLNLRVLIYKQPDTETQIFWAHFLFCCPIPTTPHGSQS